jgi:hypothetical protein
MHHRGKRHHRKPVSPHQLFSQVIQIIEDLFYRKKEIMRIGDDNLFEIGSRESYNIILFIPRH